MDPRTTTRLKAEQGLATVQFVLASVLALALFVVFANVVVVQYGRGVLRSALEQGARAGSVSGVAVCEQVANVVVGDLLGGRMSEGLVVSCELADGAIVASGSATFESWTPLTSDFDISETSRATVEP